MQPFGGRQPLEDPEEEFWSGIRKSEEQERREYERQRAERRVNPGSVARGLQELLIRAVAPSAANGAVLRSEGRSADGHAVRPLGVELSSSAQCAYRRLEDLEDDKEDREGWAPVSNLDVFFQTMYKYYQSKGFGSIMAAGATHLISMAFTVALSTWLFAFVDWHGLTTCSDETSCHTLSHYIHWEALWRPWAKRYALVWIYCGLFCAYWCASCYWFYLTVKDAAEMQRVYEERLGISREQLATMEWHEVVSRLLAKQRSGEYRVSINRDITAHDIACRIMRRENFLIAFLSCGILDLSLRLPFIGSRRYGSWSASTEQQFLTRNLEWSLHVCVLHDMFNDKFTVRREFLADEPGLRRRFVMAGLIQLALMPFLLVFMVMQFFLQNAQEWHSKRNYLGPRQWSPMAMWKFREYNELPHIFERRMNFSYPLAMEYSKHTPRPVVTAVARCLSYVSGSVVAVLLLFTLIDESILLYVKLMDRNLLWYVGVFSAVFAMSRALVPGPEDAIQADPEETMRKLAARTHHLPAHWKGRCATNEVRQEFLQLLQYKAALFQQEVLSVVVTPIILCFSLPESAKTILEFIREQHEDVDGLGSVCSYSLFDLERYGTRAYGSERDGPHATHDGKVEKSLLNFKVNYPDWQPGPCGQALLAKLIKFHDQEVGEGLAPDAPPVVMTGSSSTNTSSSTSSSSNGPGSPPLAAVRGRQPQPHQHAQQPLPYLPLHHHPSLAPYGASPSWLAAQRGALGPWGQLHGNSQLYHHSQLSLPPHSTSASVALQMHMMQVDGGGVYPPPGPPCETMEASFFWLERYVERARQGAAVDRRREAGGAHVHRQSPMPPGAGLREDRAQLSVGGVSHSPQPYAPGVSGAL